MTAMCKGVHPLTFLAFTYASLSEIIWECTLKEVEGVNSISMRDTMEKQVVSWVLRKENLVHYDR
jgi:hypothetical protein